MAKRKKSGNESGNCVVITDAQGNIYLTQAGDPVTDGLSASEKNDLRNRLKAYSKTKAGKAASGDALFIKASDGAWRILKTGEPPPPQGGDGKGHKDKKS
jgi:hypothetical protein